MVEGDSPHELLAGLDSAAFALPIERTAWNIEAVARTWFRALAATRATQLRGVVRRAIAEELAEQIAFAAENLRATARITPFPADREARAARPRVLLAPTARPEGEGRASSSPARATSSTAWAATSRPSGRRCSAASRPRANCFAASSPPTVLWDGNADEAPPRDLMFGQVTVGSLVSDLAAVTRREVRRDDRPEPRRIGRSVRGAGLARARRDVSAGCSAPRCSTPTSRRPTMRPVLLGHAARRSGGLGRAGSSPRRRPTFDHGRCGPGRRAYLLIVNTPTRVRDRRLSGPTWCRLAAASASRFTF